MLKTIVAKTLAFESLLGSAIFANVPVSVDADVDPETFNPETDDYALRGDVIDALSRDVAKRWFRDYLRFDVDDNHERRWNLTPNELKGIMFVCGVNASEFAELIGQHKSKVSKALKGEQTLSQPVVRILIRVLADELEKPGMASGFLEHLRSRGRALKPKDDFTAMKQRA